MKILRFKIKTGIFYSSKIARIYHTKRLVKQLLKLIKANPGCAYLLLESRKTKVLTTLKFIPVTQNDFKHIKYENYKQALSFADFRMGVLNAIQFGVLEDKLQYSMCYSILSTY